MAHPLKFFVFAVLITPVLRAQLPAGTRDSAVAPVEGKAAQRSAANEALERQDYRRALKLLTALTEQEPKDAQLLYDLAYTEDALDQTTTAEATYRAAMAVDPGLMEPHVGLGLLLARTNRSTEAHAELTTAASLPNGSGQLKARAYRALARLDLKANPEAARDELLAALKLSPETADDALMAAEVAEAVKDPATAEKAYRRTLAANPDDPGATVALAHLLAATAPHEAESLLTKALAAHPADPALTAQLVSLYAAQGRYREATPLAEELHVAAPADANVTRLLADLYVQAGAPEKADPLFAALLGAHPTPALLDDRADSLIRLHRFAEAEALLKQAVIDPSAFASKEAFGIAASHLAFAASNNNDPQMVLHALDVRATVLPPSPSAMFLGATAYDKLHNYKQAADLYRQFLGAAAGKFPDEEFEARHRLLALSKRN